MKIHELFEEAIPVIAAGDLWSENSDGVGQYITGKIFLVKKVDGGKFEVYQDTNGSRQLIGKMSQDKLDKSYTPVRGNQKPDAEGFTVYREVAEYEAFKYDGDTTKVEIGDGSTVKISKGDYILRQTDGDEFVYSVETARYFDQNYSKKS